MFVEEIRRAIEAAPRVTLPEVGAVMWRAFGAGHISEADAEALSALIEARKALPIAVAVPRKAVGSRPRSDASMERRRRWAASGRLPPAIAARFTLAEHAVLAVVAWETGKQGDCRLTIGHIAALAGVSHSTAKGAIRRARVLGFVTVEERRATACRNLSNIVRIVSREWQAWGRLARGPFRQGGGVKSAPGTNTQVPRGSRQRAAEATKKAAGMRKAEPSALGAKASRAAEAGMRK